MYGIPCGVTLDASRIHYIKISTFIPAFWERGRRYRNKLMTLQQAVNNMTSMWEVSQGGVAT